MLSICCAKDLVFKQRLQETIDLDTRALCCAWCGSGDPSLLPALQSNQSQLSKQARNGVLRLAALCTPHFEPDRHLKSASLGYSYGLSGVNHRVLVMVVVWLL